MATTEEWRLVLTYLHGCDAGVSWVEHMLQTYTPKEVWELCDEPGWMVWLLYGVHVESVLEACGGTYDESVTQWAHAVDNGLAEALGFDSGDVCVPWGPWTDWGRLVDNPDDDPDSWQVEINGELLNRRELASLLREWWPWERLEALLTPYVEPALAWWGQKRAFVGV